MVGSCLPPVFCPLVACGSNLVWWTFRCIPPRKWRHTGTAFHSRHWLNKNPCGLFCASVTQFFIWGAGFIVNTVIVYPWFGYGWFGVAIMAIYNMLLFMASFSHYRAMTTNPGAVPKNAEPLPALTMELKRLGKGVPKCRRSGIFKPPRAHYDRQIRRNVVRMDHHCPWVNNSIGIGNQKLFLLFLLYISLSCFFSLSLLIALWFKCHNLSLGRVVHTAVRTIHSKQAPHAIHAKTPRVCEASSSGLGAVFLALLLMESLLFGLFTACMLCDQMSSILSNRTQIDRLQGKEFEKNSFFQNLREVMGDPNGSTDWLWPTKPRWRDWEIIFGYCLPRRMRSTPMRRPPASTSDPKQVSEFVDLEGDHNRFRVTDGSGSMAGPAGGEMPGLHNPVHTVDLPR